MRLSPIAADLLLLLVALCWGGTFVVVHEAVKTYPPFLLIGGRFLLALLALMLLFPRHLRAWRTHLRPGLLLGSILLAGFALQTFGLQYTPASNSGFITGLNVLFVALIAGVFFPGRISGWTWGGVILATLGMIVLSWRGSAWHLSLGDLLTLLCALFFALHIVATGFIAPSRDPVALAGVQFAVAGLGGLALNAVVGADFFWPYASGWAVFTYLGLAATGFAFLVQTTAQRHTPSIHTAIVLAAEPLFAAAIAVLFGGEKATLQMAAGGGMIFAAMMMAITPSPSIPLPCDNGGGVRRVKG